MTHRLPHYSGLRDGHLVKYRQTGSVLFWCLVAVAFLGAGVGIAIIGG